MLARRPAELAELAAANQEALVRRPAELAAANQEALARRTVVLAADHREALVRRPAELAADHQEAAKRGTAGPVADDLETIKRRQQDVLQMYNNKRVLVNMKLDFRCALRFQNSRRITR